MEKYKQISVYRVVQIVGASIARPQKRYSALGGRPMVAPTLLYETGRQIGI